MVRLVDAVRPIAAMTLLLTAVGSACAGDTNSRGISSSSPGPQSFTLYALSRGKGVPESAKAALTRTEAVLQGLRDQGADIRVAKERIGLEGETRLCVTFADADLARETLGRIRQLGTGVDLFSLVEEPCGTAPPQKP